MTSKFVKQLLAAVLAAGISICALPTGYVSAQAAQPYGFVQTDKGVKWADQDGSFLTNDWIHQSGKTYWVNSDGYVQYGLVDVNGDTYLLLPEGTMQIGWYQNDNGIYYFDTDGKMVKDSEVQGYEIGPDGIVKGMTAEAAAQKASEAADSVQTSASQSANALLVNQILSTFITPDMTDEQKLRAAFDHVLSTTSYKRTYETPSGDWTWNYAMDIYTTGLGNCYRYASAFAYLARGLGYETRVVTGTISARRGGVTPHGWVEVKVGDTWYICDPDMQDCSSGNYYMRTFENYPVKPLNKETEWPIEL